MNHISYLIGHLIGGDWSMTFIFPHIGNVVIPIDEVIFFRGVSIPPTSHRSYMYRSDSPIFFTVHPLPKVSLDVGGKVGKFCFDFKKHRPGTVSPARMLKTTG